MKFLFVFVCFSICLINAGEPQNLFTATIPDDFLMKEITGAKYFFMFGTTKYTITKVIGCGGVGCPFVVEDQAKVKKIVKLPKAMDEKKREYLGCSSESEITTAKQIQKEMADKTCPNVLKIVDITVFQYPEYASDCQVMAILVDYVDGGDFNSLSWTPTAPPTKGDLISLMKGVVDGVQCIHQNYNRYHIDLKPANVMYEKN